MTGVKRALALVVAVGCALGVAWLSHIPTSYAGADDALLRLSWRVDGIMVEECRARTAEELEALAPHMRTPEICTGTGADYGLRVDLDEAAIARDTVTPAGARRDRPVYVFREFELAPGRYRLTVAFDAMVPPSYDPGDAPVRYAWQGEVALESTDIALITLDESGRTLVLRDR